MASRNLQRLGSVLVLGGLVLWLANLYVADNLDSGSSDVWFAIVTTLAILLPAIVLLGIVALIVGAAILDNHDEWIESRKDVERWKIGEYAQQDLRQKATDATNQ